LGQNVSSGQGSAANGRKIELAMPIGNGILPSALSFRESTKMMNLSLASSERE
jgi:hypothetical protein